MKLLSMICLLILMSSCQLNSKRLPVGVIDKKIPTIAVLEFADKSHFRYRWNVGEGIRDSLIDELVQSKRYKVLTRENIDAVIGELDIQQDKLFRPEGKVARGRLKNVQYLLKGSVTDFAHVAKTGASAFFSSWGFSSSTHVAVVTVTLYIIEVESGEIIASKQVEGKAHATSIDVGGQYKDMSFGSGSFYRTPLGKACKELMKEALLEINKTIADEKWHPRVIRTEGDTLILSGGEDRAIQVGNLYSAYFEGSPLIDPETGDILGHSDSQLIGRIQITKVNDKFSYAKIIKGSFRQGQILRQVIVVPNKNE
ncbi:CsgG/HfaB family protein [Lentisphaera profundi]|uniref:CsgG/HfaB family protein n=1 Tax=Lentisphaera profundi TaxID=1658616 RepID=A0ABY7VW82_9BACT|nr:CsgG/HfaB family protein [Lentisphaera profundi]WDE98495.1 CsgG/HfaB family protein [Lentisphaera profundi]